MKRLLLLPFITFAFVSIVAQTNDTDFKKLGMDALRSNQLDSALSYLYMAIGDGINDGEVLGGVALIYFQKGDNRRALSYARKARKQKGTVTPDAFIAGVLASEQAGEVKLRNRWLNQGLKYFPGDYLLLFHAGRVTITFNSREGEQLLLRAVQAAPWFAESHYLLGQEMYRRGENLKAVLPWFYFLLLENNTGRSKETVLNIERLYKAWAASSVSLPGLRGESRGLVTNFRPIEGGFNPADYSARATWFAEQSLNLVNSLVNIKTSPDDILWGFYSDFFYKAVILDKVEALAWHLVNARYPAETLAWVASNPERYKAMANWLSVQ